MPGPDGLDVTLIGGQDQVTSTNYTLEIIKGVTGDIVLLKSLVTTEEQ